jgi:hypothetical protein
MFIDDYETFVLATKALIQKVSIAQNCITISNCLLAISYFNNENLKPIFQ